MMDFRKVLRTIFAGVVVMVAGAALAGRWTTSLSIGFRRLGAWASWMDTISSATTAS